jgi:hypothetical protein
LGADHAVCAGQMKTSPQRHKAAKEKFNSAFLESWRLK